MEKKKMFGDKITQPYLMCFFKKRSVCCVAERKVFELQYHIFQTL